MSVLKVIQTDRSREIFKIKKKLMPYLQLFVAKKREKKRNIYENDCNISGKSVLLENLFCSSDMYERFFIIIIIFFSAGQE